MSNSTNELLEPVEVTVETLADSEVESRFQEITEQLEARTPAEVKENAQDIEMGKSRAGNDWPNHHWS